MGASIKVPVNFEGLQADSEQGRALQESLPQWLYNLLFSQQ